MRVYLAASYGRHKEMQDYAHDLRLLGHDPVSRWIWGSHKISDDIPDDSAKAQEIRALYAYEDLTDLTICDLVLGFTGTKLGRGGRHVEHGYALALRKPIWLVGPRENVFHWLPEVRQFESWEQCKEVLAVVERISV